MRIEELKDKKILIMGMGREGFATARFLKALGLGNALAAADKKAFEEYTVDEQKFLQDGFELHLGQEYLKNWSNYDVIIKSPGLSIRQFPEIEKAIAGGAKLTSATNIFFANKLGKVIAVTGSKGKSTTSSLIYALLKAGNIPVDLVGNIGKPALDFLLADMKLPEQEQREKYYVFEISSYQLEDFNSAAEMAVLVSFFPEHMDYHGGEEPYFQAKMNLISHLGELSKVIYNFASEKLRAEIVRRFGTTRSDKLIPFNDGEAIRLAKSAQNDEWCLEVDGKAIISASEVKLKGRHNLENMLAGCAVARELGIEWSVVKGALGAFVGLEHRLELVGKYKGVTFYNDSFSTAPESTQAALEALGGEAVIGTMIAGGVDRGYKYEGLAKSIVETGVKNLVLFPVTGALIEKAVREYCAVGGGDVPGIYTAGNMPEAVEMAYKLSPSESLCLLSCASPSFNLFRNFEERGNLFKNFVREFGKS